MNKQLAAEFVLQRVVPDLRIVRVVEEQRPHQRRSPSNTVLCLAGQIRPQLLTECHKPTRYLHHLWLTCSLRHVPRRAVTARTAMVVA
ncbi:MAG: hypothetical protein Q605_AUC00696G0001, partial [Actinomyces urogenitalis DORA_12]